MVRFTPFIILALSAGIAEGAGECKVAPEIFTETYLGLPSIAFESASIPNKNPNCAYLGFDYGYKFDGCQDKTEANLFTSYEEPTDAASCAVKTTGAAVVECDSNGIDATITPNEDTVVIMKGGDVGGVVYKLKAGEPVTINVGKQRGISHVEFCFICNECAGAIPDAPAPDASAPDAPAPAPTAPAPDAPAPAPDAPAPAPDADPAGDEENVKAFTRGDPHFKTFGGELYDYHGECDMVLLSNPNFKNGLGMTVHIRTKIQDFWSSVESAAIKIGDDFLEVAGGDAKEWLWVNGEANENLDEETWYRTSLAGFLVRFKQTGSVREANIYLEGAKEVLVIKTYHDFVRVDINWVDSENYGGSVGLLGAKDSNGVRAGRGGNEIKDVNDFGQEWQVKEDEDKLFHNYDENIVQAPAKCALPPSMTDEKVALRARRLAESDLTVEKAEKACEHVQGAAERKACAYDILATQDINMAGAW